MKILRIQDLPQDFDQLETEALLEGHNFLSKMKREWLEGKNRFALDQEALFAAYSNDGILIGIGGLNRDPYIEDPTIGRVRHVFVASNFRRSGVGEALLNKIVEHARKHFEVIRLKTRNPAAVLFYERLGFVTDAKVANEIHSGLRMKL